MMGHGVAKGKTVCYDDAANKLPSSAGESTAGQELMEFYADKDAPRQTLTGLFCERRGPA